MMCEDSPNQSVAPYLCWQFAVFLPWCKRPTVRCCHTCLSIGLSDQLKAARSQKFVYNSTTYNILDILLSNFLIYCSQPDILQIVVLCDPSVLECFLAKHLFTCINSDVNYPQTDVMTYQLLLCWVTRFALLYSCWHGHPPSKVLLAHCFIRRIVSFCVCGLVFVFRFTYVYSHGCLGQVIQPGAQQHK